MQRPYSGTPTEALARSQKGTPGRWATYTLRRSKQVLAWRLQNWGRVRKDDQSPLGTVAQYNLVAL
jgi:hypothetical protein